MSFHLFSTAFILTFTYMCITMRNYMCVHRYVHLHVCASLCAFTCVCITMHIYLHVHHYAHLHACASLCTVHITPTLTMGDYFATN